MHKIEETLWKDYGDASNRINEESESNENLKMAYEERDKVRNEIIKLKLSEMETEVKKSQIIAENEREKKRNRTTLVTLGVSTFASLVALGWTFAFDKEHTPTSTAGRGIISGFIPKIKWK